MSFPRRRESRKPYNSRPDPPYPPEYLLDQLMKYVNNSYDQGFIDNNGVKTSLLAHLESAKRKFSNLEGADEKEYNKNRTLAVEELRQFIKKVEKFDNFIYQDVAVNMIKKINFIITNK